MTRETVTVSGGARKTPRAPVSSGPAGSRRAANKAEVRRRVLRAARELFARRGPAGTTMDDVARLAEVSRATVFNHFSGKAEIVRELVAAFERGFRHAVDRQLCRTAPSAERIRAVFEDTAREILRAPALSRFLIREAESGFGTAKGSGRDMARMFGAIGELLDAGRQEGDVRADVSIETLAELVGGTYMAILHGWRLSPRYPLACRLDEAARVLGEIIVPRPAAAAIPPRAAVAPGQRRRALG